MRQGFPLKSAVLAPILALAASAGPAMADPADLTLTTDKVHNDPGGAFISVSVKNNTAATINQIVVTCSFTNGGAKVGTSTTTLFATVGGTTGSDQVRLLGQSATSADCAITSPK